MVVSLFGLSCLVGVSLASDGSTDRTADAGVNASGHHQIGEDDAGHDRQGGSEGGFDGFHGWVLGVVILIESP